MVHPKTGQCRDQIVHIHCADAAAKYALRHTSLQDFFEGLQSRFAQQFRTGDLGQHLPTLKILLQY